MCPRVRKQIERFFWDQENLEIDIYNEDIEAFEVVADTYARKVSTLEEEAMPRDWSAWDHQFCVMSTDPPDSVHARTHVCDHSKACWPVTI